MCWGNNAKRAGTARELELVEDPSQAAWLCDLTAWRPRPSERCSGLLLTSALLGRSPFNKSGNFRNTLAQVASSCELLASMPGDSEPVVALAPNPPRSAAHEDHLGAEHSPEDGKHRDLLTVGA